MFSARCRQLDIRGVTAAVPLVDLEDHRLVTDLDDLVKYRVEMCAELLDRKAAYSILDQPPSGPDASELARTLHEAIADRCEQGPDVTLTEAWLASLHEGDLERPRVSSFSIDGPGAAL